MPVEDRAFTLDEKLKFTWGVVYLFAALTLIFRLIYLWDLVWVRPFPVASALLGLFNLLFLAVPIGLGLLFRLRLEREFAAGSMRESFFQLCSFALPILLATAFLTMFLYEGL